MNEFSLKITGAASIPEQLDASKSIYIITELECYEVSKKNLQSGDHEITYKTKMIGAAELRQAEKKQISRNKTKASQRLRWAIEAKGRALGVDDVELFYTNRMNEIISKENEV